MKPTPVRAWNETDIPHVAANDLAAATQLWLERERAGLLPADAPSALTVEAIEARIIDMHDDPARGLSVLYRLRGLVDALHTRRFRSLVRHENAARLARLIEAAAAMPLNPRWGFSPLRLAWAVGAEQGEARKAA